MEVISIGTEVQFRRIIWARYLTWKPEQIKGGKVIEYYDLLQEYLVEAPAVAIKVYTSRYGKGFLDAMFRLNEGNDWDPALEIGSFDGEFIGTFGRCTTKSHSFL